METRGFVQVIKYQKIGIFLKHLMPEKYLMSRCILFLSIWSKYGLRVLSLVTRVLCAHLIYFHGRKAWVWAIIEQFRMLLICF